MKQKMGRKKIRQFLAWLLILSISVQYLPAYAQEGMPGEKAIEVKASEEKELQEKLQEQELTEQFQEDNIQEEVLKEVPEEELPLEAPEKVPTEELQPEANYQNVYEEGIVKIYHSKQLLAIGSGQPVRIGDEIEEQFGTGEPILAENQSVTYSNTCTYQLMNDISLDGSDIWMLPSEFTGKFTENPLETDPLYDPESDTIYVYNNYQLQLIGAEMSEQEPVMSKDMLPEQIGMGQLLYKDGTPAEMEYAEAQKYLTYSKAHRYVLSKHFTADMPEPLAQQYVTGTLADNQLGGRSHVGQQYVEKTDANGKNIKYILIGNEQQLRAIGTGMQVTPMLFVKSGTINPKLIPYYPGDADFNLHSLGTTDEMKINYDGIRDGILNYKYFEQDDVTKRNQLMNADLKNPSGLLESVGNILEGLLGGLGEILTGKEIVGLQNENTDQASIGPNKHLGQDDFADIQEIRRKYGDLQYTSDANYIIFRNIDLKSGPYSNEQDDLWNPIHVSGTFEGQLGMNPDSFIQIENINITQTGKMSLQHGNGIGFFGSISSNLNEDTYKSNPVTVKNIHLKTIMVDNQSSEVDKTPESLVEGLTGLLGGLLGSLLDTILEVLNINLGKVIKDLLTLKQKSADMFATGAFAGRITGNVTVENCTVEDAAVKSVMGMSGGFVGYTRGDEEYEFLSGTLKNLVKLLSALLNIIPGVGLGDLITILLENDVALGELIPVRYYRPVIQNCSVSFKASTMGNTTTDYHGGFVGLQIGTKCEECHVKNLTFVQADNYAGGFAGFAKEAQIQGALTSLGVDTAISAFDIESAQISCSVDGGSGISIKTIGEYAGGMNGIMTNSSSTGCSVTNLKSVEAKNYAGGFTGRATIGAGFSVSSENEHSTLLKAVTKLLGSVLGGKSEDALLTITGAKPTRLDNITVSGTGWSVTAIENYAGGLFGQGDGVVVNSSTEATAQIQNLSNVSAGNYAGGIGGSAVVANPIGVLNKTFGIGRYLSFRLNQVMLTGAPLSVKATGTHAAGGLGLMLGGAISEVSIQDLSSVAAANYAGGFAGRAGSGALLKSEGINLLGLNLVKIDNIISLAEGTPMKVSDTTVSGTSEGITIFATGQTTLTEGEDILAGGFVAEVEGMTTTDSSVSNLKRVVAEKASNKESFAGGFVGRNNTGGLAGIAQEQDGALKLPGIVNVSGLVDLVPYLIPEYINCKTSFISNKETEETELPQVKAYSAGGFFGEMQSGKINNSAINDGIAVANLSFVEGEGYAGGFAGFIHAGATASSDGLKLLDSGISLDIADLLQVLNVYIPKITSAGVTSSDRGLKVEATGEESYAGGYAGKASGAQIELSNVSQLRYTKVTPPSDNLESTKCDSYFNGKSDYAVKAGKTAGGFVGLADIGSAASVGGGLKLLKLIQANDVLSAVDSVATKIKDCNVAGQIGGYSVLANGHDNVKAKIGTSGGFAGECSGSQITNSDAMNFAYIIGREAAGGYVGCMNPGSVASILEDATVINKLLNVKDVLASVINTFIPIIDSCQTTCIPCGGAVRAEGLTDNAHQRGIAGGYAGLNQGGRIKGSMKECAVVRIRSVYGGEFAGGFTGLMETASLVQSGNLSLLFGLVNLNNVLDILGAVYPTEENTAVYGPLRKMDVETWNNWSDHIGENGVYGPSLPSGPVADQIALDELIRKYAYGYHVRAGRETAGEMERQAGVAGGYVGRMKGGVITEAHAWDAKNILAYESSGGFAGEMITGGAASVGNVDILKLDVLGSISAVNTFVPVIRNSDVTGYQSGLTVSVTGVEQQDNKIEKVGYAGGFVGHMIGGQIWGNYKTEIQTMSQTDAIPDAGNNRCFVHNLRRVDGTNSVGGFAGQIDPGSAVALDTASSQGLLNGLLQKLIGTPGDLLQVLNATLSTVRASDVVSWDPYGIIINGSYANGTDPNTKYADSAGGFAGEINGAVLGELKNSESGNHVKDLRSVIGGEHVGGFFGLADVSATANIGKQNENISIIQDLLKLGSTDVLDAFRTYIYDSSVEGSAGSGLEVIACDGKKVDYVNEPEYTGNAGGFGGTMLNGTIKRSSVSGLRAVRASNYSGGFTGHLGKSGVLDLDNLGVFSQVLGVGAGALDLFGAHIENCAVDGMAEGFTVRSENLISPKEKLQIAGGFVGYADLAKMNQNTVTNLKQVSSPEIAGGFAGKTNFAYLLKLQGDSLVVNKLLDLLNIVLKALWVADLQDGNIIRINLGFIEVDALCKGNLVHINLLGLDLKIKLAKDQSLASIFIGDSEIKLNCKEDGSLGLLEQEQKNEIGLNLIKGNRSTVKGNSVTGILKGYDVYGGNADNYNNGIDVNGYAGGFVGLNREGLFQENKMVYADVVRGTKEKTGPFTGKTVLDSVYNFNTVKGIEGYENYYNVYRKVASVYQDILNPNNKPLEETTTSTVDTTMYQIKHRGDGKVEEFVDLKDATLNGTNVVEIPANVYLEEGAMAKLMDHTPTEPTPPGTEVVPPDAQDPCKETVELRIEKQWKGDRPEKRPDEIRLTITRAYKDAKGELVTDTTFKKEVVMTKDDQISADIWERIVSDPEFKAYYVDNDIDQTKRYYIYSITEGELAEYTTTIQYSGENQYTMTIINKKEWFQGILPDTGGMHIVIFYGIGILLLALYGVMYHKKTKHKSRAKI